MKSTKYDYNYAEVALHVLCQYGNIKYNVHIFDEYCNCDNPTFYYCDEEYRNLCRDCEKEEICWQYFDCEACGEILLIKSDDKVNDAYDIYTDKLHAYLENGCTVMCQSCFDKLNDEIDKLKKSYSKCLWSIYFITEDKNYDILDYIKRTFVCSILCEELNILVEKQRNNWLS